MMAFSDEEWSLRHDLANLYHLIEHFGWHEMIMNHISVRLPEGDRYLVNPFGLNYSEITPANLLVVNVDGELIGASDYGANPAGFALHGAIHTHRHDIRCVAHTHTIPISAVAMKDAGFDHNNFYGAQLIGRVAYHEFEGITLFADERDRMVASLGEKDVLVLRNHGVAVCERDIPSTFMLHYIVQRAAEVQCQAGMIPGGDRKISDDVMERCRISAARLSESNRFSTLLFESQVRAMRKAKPVEWYRPDRAS
ncbi:class II aldolase/adducin family protein [Sphingobium sp. YR768]|uniref:class II aldolase/adducin family protein n=1 Tax=Sphingobium sp. YR768 TaxID=1884365 RepID=UPI0008CE632D|nr:class II aldolase/adducin family protein [Sphingobium sp. YR768]SER29802.1 Ribulose-5-phosphate 4-epimerase/Fuculose-1-phosphate aldolase [Sphingobium sp. YR768]